MTLVIERPKLTSPPQLPPFLTRKRGPERGRIMIVPDISFMETQTTIRDYDNNWQTTIYQWMNRVVGEGLLDPAATWERAHTSTRHYRQWLETYETKTDIPPHISFGGAIKAGKGDETFYPRWVDYARRTFC